MSAIPTGASPDGSGAVETTRLRILDATVETLTRLGAKKLSMSAVATVAGVSRPTLYRYFPSKRHLLTALAEHQQRRFDTGLADAIGRAPRDGQLDAVLRFVVAFQTADETRGLVDVEPAFVLDRLTRMLPIQRAILARLLAEHVDDHRADGNAGEIADLIVRTALSYFLIPGGDEGELLRALRIVGRIAVEDPAR